MVAVQLVMPQSERGAREIFAGPQGTPVPLIVLVRELRLESKAKP